MITILIDQHQNPNNRMLVQEYDKMYVLSGCCGDKFDADYKVTDKDGNTEVWARCTGCGTLLDKNDSGWAAVLSNIGQFAEYMPSSIALWGRYWFGLDEFGMEVRK